MCVIISATACVCVNDSPLETTVMLCVETNNRKGNNFSVTFPKSLFVWRRIRIELCY